MKKIIGLIVVTIPTKKELSESLVLFLSITKAMVYHQPSEASNFIIRQDYFMFSAEKYFIKHISPTSWHLNGS